MPIVAASSRASSSSRDASEADTAVTATALSARRKVMAEAIREHGLEIAGGGQGGSSFWMCAPEGVDTTELALKLQGKGVLIEPGAKFFPQEDGPRRFYRLAYSSIPKERIPEGIELIAKAIAA